MTQRAKRIDNPGPTPAPDHEPDDAALLERWRAGDEAAGLTLFRRFYPEVERFFMNKIASGVGDLVQETFTAIVAARDRVQDAGKFRPYLFSIAYNVLRTRFRKQWRHPEHVPVEEATAFDVSPGPSSVAVEREEQRLLLEALRRISLADQVLLELVYWENMRIGDIAPILGCPLNTAKRRLQKARERLKRKLTELARSPEILATTLSDLDTWARDLAERRDDEPTPG